MDGTDYCTHLPIVESLDYHYYYLLFLIFDMYHIVHVLAYEYIIMKGFLLHNKPTIFSSNTDYINWGKLLPVSFVPLMYECSVVHFKVTTSSAITKTLHCCCFSLQLSVGNSSAINLTTTMQ